MLPLEKLVKEETTSEQRTNFLKSLEKWDDIQKAHRYLFKCLRSGKSDDSFLELLRDYFHLDAHEFDKALSATREQYDQEQEVKLKEMIERQESHHSKIPADKECCYNCRSMLWAVGIGVGVRCAHPDNARLDLVTKEKGKYVLPVVPTLRDKWCEKFISRSNENCNLKRSLENT